MYLLSLEILLLWISSFFQFARYHPSSLSKNVNRDEGCKFKCQNIGMRSFFWKLFFRIFIPNRYIGMDWPLCFELLNFFLFS
jgi:hypothetical protein